MVFWFPFSERGTSEWLSSNKKYTSRHAAIAFFWRIDQALPQNLRFFGLVLPRPSPVATSTISASTEVDRTNGASDVILLPGNTKDVSEGSSSSWGGSASVPEIYQQKKTSKWKFDQDAPKNGFFSLEVNKLQKRKIFRNCTKHITLSPSKGVIRLSIYRKRHPNPRLALQFRWHPLSWYRADLFHLIGLSVPTRKISTRKKTKNKK